MNYANTIDRNRQIDYCIRRAEYALKKWVRDWLPHTPFAVSCPVFIDPSAWHQGRWICGENEEGKIVLWYLTTEFDEYIESLKLPRQRAIGSKLSIIESVARPKLVNDATRKLLAGVVGFTSCDLTRTELENPIPPAAWASGQSDIALLRCSIDERSFFALIPLRHVASTESLNCLPQGLATSRSRRSLHTIIHPPESKSSRRLPWLLGGTVRVNDESDLDLLPPN